MLMPLHVFEVQMIFSSDAPIFINIQEINKFMLFLNSCETHINYFLDKWFSRYRRLNCSQVTKPLKTHLSFKWAKRMAP